MIFKPVSNRNLRAGLQRLIVLQTIPFASSHRFCMGRCQYKNLMNYNFIILICLIFFSLFSCSNDDDSPQDESIFYWNETKCADPWNTGENRTNGETEVAVKVYLANENINIQNLGFDNKSPLATDCEACDCGTGQRIIVDVEDSDIPKMKELEFYQ